MKLVFNERLKRGKNNMLIVSRLYFHKDNTGILPYMLVFKTSNYKEKYNTFYYSLYVLEYSKDFFHVWDMLSLYNNSILVNVL